MPPFIHDLTTLNFGTEIIYSFVIIVCSLMIYFGTKELYSLSTYKGLKYFRQSFLFFAIAYFFRSFIKLLVLYFDVIEPWRFSPRFFGPATLFLFVYFSSIAMFYLVYSFIWKDWNDKSKYIFHASAFIIALVSISFRTPIAYFFINAILIIFVIGIVSYQYHKSSKKIKGHNLYIIYLLLLVFWIFNILDILIPAFFQTFKLLLYLISSGIFLAILYKVLKKVGSN